MTGLLGGLVGKKDLCREGETHHELDHEEEHWMERSGIEIHHVSSL